MKAKALYDNISDDVEELSFSKNEILEVLEEDYDGMEGWWLCKLGEKTGIAPGNRLLILNDTDKDYEQPKRVVSDRQSRSDDYDTPSSKTLKNNIDRTSSNSKKNRSSGDRTSKLFATFKKVHKELEMPNQQLIQMIDRWVSCQNSKNVQTVIKTMCVKHWKQMQEYVAESSKLVPYSPQEANTCMQKIKQLSKDLEDILEKISKECLKQEIYIENLNSLKKITNALSENMTVVKNIYGKLEEENSTEERANTKYQSVASFSGMDYDTPKNMNNLYKSNFQNSTLTLQHNNSLGNNDYDRPKSIENSLINSLGNNDYDRPKSIENSLMNSLRNNDYDRPKSLENSIRKSSEVFNGDYDMPRKSMEVLNNSSKVIGTDSLDYDRPTKLSPTSFLSNTNQPNTRACSDLIKNADYDVPSVDETRKSMDHLDSIKNNSNLPFNSLLKKSLEMSDYDYPSVSDSYINDANKFQKVKKPIRPNNNKNILMMTSKPQTNQKPSPKPSFDDKEVKLLKYYKPKIIEKLEIINEKIKSTKDEVSSDVFDLKTFTNHLKQLVISLYKMVYLIDFNTKKLSKHVHLCGELNLLCKKSIDCAQSIASFSEYSESGNLNAMKTSIQVSLDKMKDFSHNIEETIRNLEF